MNRAILTIAFASLLCGCSNKEDQMSSLYDMSAARANLAFTCVHESDHLPPLDPQADALFKYGRYLEKQNGPKDFHGHYKANSNLQQLVSQGFASSPHSATETVGLAEQLIKAGVPGGYYDMGHYLELGYGVKQDADKSRRYFRKAADLGSPEAQAYIGELLSPLDKAPGIARQMRQCATDQGYGDAASKLGIDLKTDKLYPEAVKAFQKGGQAGNTLSAWALKGGFNGPAPSELLDYMGLTYDAERARRYELIWKFLISNEGRNPKVPDIDQIVPLPPARLPPWDGTFQWQKEQDAAVPPPKPSDELIERLSKAKSLDPATGLPLPGTKATTSKPEPAEAATAWKPVSLPGRLPLGSVARTGQPCPEDGAWHVVTFGKGLAVNGDERWIRRGAPMPSLVVQLPRRLALLDRMLGMREQTVEVTWHLHQYHLGAA
jgi:tetratricopeptide (TPR) repeat protein